MPNWSPNWADVQFDRPIAEKAAEECERAARVIRDVTLQRAVMEAFALLDAKGPWQDHLTRKSRALHDRSDELDARLRAMADALRDASTRARAEQASRVADRQRWYDEARAEAALLLPPSSPVLPQTVAPPPRWVR